MTLPTGATLGEGTGEHMGWGEAYGIDDVTDARDGAAAAPPPPPCLFLKSHIRSDGFVLIVAESFRGRYAVVQPFLALLAEPVSRPPLVHEYKLTPFSLGTAVSGGVTAQEAIAFLVKNTYELNSMARGGGAGEGTAAEELLMEVHGFITSCMTRYNLARVVTDERRTMVQCRTLDTATQLLSDKVIRSTAAEPFEVTYELGRWGRDGTAGDSDDETRFPSFLLQSRAMSKVVAARCAVLGLPVQQQYDYERDDSIRQANITLRSQTKPRAYQVEAADAAAADGTLNSGCLLLPCGAGKTLLGIMLMCKVRKPTLVICAGSVSVEQWKNQILEYATLEPPTTAPLSGNGGPHHHADQQQQRGKTFRSGASRISCLTGKQKDPIDEDTDVVLTTYSMLVSAHRAHARKRAHQMQHQTSDDATAEAFTERGTRKRRPNPKEQLFSPYGLLILDEVHVMPAEAFQESLGYLDAKGVVGLTATYVREDRKILDLFHLVGPKLYDVSMESLAAQGYLATVNCVEVHTPMTREFGMEYLERSAQTGQAQQTGKAPALVMLAAANPNKMLCVRQLVERHLDAGSKILVFCDHIMLLYEYGRLLNMPVISGKTQHRERLMIFSDFQTTSKVNAICVSRVGDVSVNLPSANVVIQVSSHGGSRRQEAQRLGRILRPKERAANGATVEAWFYSVISSDTLEVAHAAHRTAFLVDQGYTCRLMRFDPAKAGLHSLEEYLSPAKTEPGTVAAGAATVKTDHPPKPEEEELIGDIETIKQEHLRSGGRARIRSAVAAATSTGEAKMRSLSYQLELLSKVISSWEIEFQEQSRKRRRASAAEGGDASRRHAGGAQRFSDDDDDVVVVNQQRPPRDFDDIKREWADGSPPSGRPEERAASGRSRVQLSDLVGVNDGFVYHEL